MAPARVIVWDRGTWEPVGDPREGMAAGKLLFNLYGEKLAGRWELVRIAKPGDKSEQWILFKKRDAWARPLAEFDVFGGVSRQCHRQTARCTDPGVAEFSRHGCRGDSHGRPARAFAGEAGAQFATLSPTLPPAGTGWVVETKFDGYRMLARIEDARVTLFTRNGHDWTRKLKSLAAELEKLDISEGWLDGEIVVLRDGVPDFNALQNAIDRHRNEAIVFFAFDLPFWEGRDLRNVPLVQRRAKLEALVAGHSDRVRFSEAFDAPPVQIFQQHAI